MDKMKIIVVEDNPVYNTFVCKLLANNGFKTEQIYHLSSARKALIKADNDDIVLADLRLPNGESIELLKWMRVNDKRQAFIIMTDYAEVHTAVESMKLGSLDYIPKQLVEDKLISLLHSIIKEREQKRQRQVPIFIRQGGSVPQHQETGTPCCTHPDERADIGRERHGQGAYRPRHPYPKLLFRQTFRGGGLRFTCSCTCPIRFFRSCQGSVHGCGLQQNRIFSGSRGRYAVS